MKYGLAALVLLVIVLHQDFWNWTNKSLVMGFHADWLGLSYRLCLSRLLTYGAIGEVCLAFTS